MESPKATLIKPKKKHDKEQNKKELIGPILMLLIGIILFTDSSKAVVIVCYAIGTILTIFGVYNIISYYRLKNELKIEDPKKNMLGIITIFIGVLIIILSSAIETILRFIIGFTLLFNGIKKLIISLNFKSYFTIVEGILFIGCGLYTIFAENIVFQVIGLFLIFASIIDLINFITQKK